MQEFELNIKIKVCTNESCKITVQDLTDNYQPEDNTNSNYGTFRYSDTLSIDVLQLNKTTGTQLLNPVYSLHEDKLTPVTLPVSFDGWFKIQHIVLPTKEWFDREQEKGELSIVRFYEGVYYSDGKKVYKYYNGQSTITDLDEVIERNTENTTIHRYTEDYVSICFLRKCYINLCQQIFNSRAFDKCWNKNKIDSELVFKRDLVWMAINVIKYMVEFNQFAEAARLIERLTSCNGLCQNMSSTSNKSIGCGCN